MGQCGRQAIETSRQAASRLRPDAPFSFVTANKKGFGATTRKITRFRAFVFRAGFPGKPDGQGIPGLRGGGGFGVRRFAGRFPENGFLWPSLQATVRRPRSLAAARPRLAPATTRRSCARQGLRGDVGHPRPGRLEKIAGQPRIFTSCPRLSFLRNSFKKLPGTFLPQSWPATSRHGVVQALRGEGGTLRRHDGGQRRKASRRRRLLRLRIYMDQQTSRRE